MTHRNKRPAIQWYTGDWMKDPALGQCSPATRGIWMDMLCLMHENGETGVLKGSPESLARICRCTAEEMRLALAELDGTKTGHVTVCPSGVRVTNRRMAKSHEKRVSERNRKRKQRGGNAPERDMSRSVPEMSLPYSSTSTSKQPGLTGLPGFSPCAPAREEAPPKNGAGLTGEQRVAAQQIQAELEQRREAEGVQPRGPRHVAATVTALRAEPGNPEPGSGREEEND